MSPMAENTLDTIRQNPGKIAGEIAEIMGAPSSRIYDAVRDLLYLGKIERREGFRVNRRGIRHRVNELYAKEAPSWANGPVL